MELQVADWVIVAVTLTAAILGIFGGFSGALGFGAGLAAAAAAVRFGRPAIGEVLSTGWAVALATLVAALLAFGVVRLIVKKVVNGLLAQPADAIFGSLLAGVSGAALALAAVWGAITFAGVAIDSVFYRTVMNFAGQA